MGLDHELRIASRLEDEDIEALRGFKTADEVIAYLNDRPASWWMDDSIDDQKDLISCGIMLELEVDDAEADLEDVAEALGMPKRVRPVRYLGDRFQYSSEMRKKHNLKEWYTIDDFKHLEKKVRRRIGIANMKTLQYWRKYYDLSEDMAEAHGTPMENCGHYRLNDAMRKVAKRWFRREGLPAPDMPDEPGKAITVYWEWY